MGMGLYYRMLLPKEGGADSDGLCGRPCKLVSPPPAAKHEKPSTVLPLSLGIFGLGFLLLSYFVMRRLSSTPRTSEYNTNTREEDEIDNPIWYIRTMGLPQSLLDSIQIVRYQASLIATTDCSVCLTQFQQGEDLRLLSKCRHAFHVVCIDTWLRSHTTCPLCRSPLNATDLGERGGGDDDGDGVVVMVDQEEEEEEEVEEAVMRRSVSMDSFMQPNKFLLMKRSISFSLCA